MGPTVQEIIQAAWKLTQEERNRLVQALSAGTNGGARRVTELRGLGKEIWRGEDAQKYVDHERESWAG